MKLKLPEHDHKLTNFLKVLLFGLLMCLPFLDIGTRCGYVLLNKNAYQSYGGITENSIQNEVINSLESFNTSDTYFLSNVYANNTTGNIGNSNQTIYVSNFEVIDNYSEFDLSNTIKIGFYQNPNSNNIGYYFWYNDTQNYNISSNTHFLVKFNYLSNNLPTSNNVLNNSNSIYKQTFTNYNSLDNVFDYSINKMAESPLYNWTQSTGMYTGVNAMTTGLGITTPLFAILITYWLFLTIIYIILDIVLTLFTFMTHIFTSKKE